VNRFFCTTAFTYPDDYHQRAIFGEFPYSFQIALKETNQSTKRVIGDRLALNYGSIRRVVLIKGTSNATINQSYIQNHTFFKTDNITTHVFSILINNTQLLGDVRNPAYQIDTTREQITINITDLKSTIREFPTAAPPITRATSAINLTDMKLYKKDAGTYSNVPLPVSNYPYVDGNATRLSSFPAPVTDNITIKLNPQYIESMKAANSQIFITLPFPVNPASSFLNNTQVLPNIASLDGQLTFENANTTPFIYDYNPANVTQPKLRNAILEVAVWSGDTGLEPNFVNTTSTIIFADDFDAVGAPSGWNIVGIAENFGGTPHEGVATIRLRDTPSELSRTISTVGYSGITISFDMGSQLHHAGKYIVAQWSPDGGTTWNDVKQIFNGDPEDDNALHPFSYTLPAGAGGNANFRIRFYINANNPGDKAYVDNVLITGIAV